MAVHGGSISVGGFHLIIAGEVTDPATSNNFVYEPTEGYYLYSGSGNKEIGITGLMPMGPGDYYLY